MENKKTSHDSSILSDSTVNDTKKRCLGLVSKNPGILPKSKCDIQCFAMGKQSQLIQKHFHKILTNVQQYLKTTKEDAQTFSACTGSVW